MTDLHKIATAKKLVDIAGDLIHELYEAEERDDIKKELNRISGFTANAFNGLNWLPYNIHNPEALKEE